MATLAVMNGPASSSECQQIGRSLKRASSPILTTSFTGPRRTTSGGINRCVRFAPHSRNLLACATRRQRQHLACDAHIAHHRELGVLYPIEDCRLATPQQPHQHARQLEHVIDFPLDVRQPAPFV